MLGRFVTTWQGVVRRRPGADALLDVVEQLQGASLPASILETEILPARIEQYDPADLDAVLAAGEIVWVGVESLGDRDGRVALYLADHSSACCLPTPVALEGGQRPTVRQCPASGGPGHVRLQLGTREKAILDYLRAHGASFFGPLHEAVGGGYPAETVACALDARLARASHERQLPRGARVHRGACPAAPGAAPRSAALSIAASGSTRRRRSMGARAAGLIGSASSRRPHKVRPATTTSWAAALAQQLLARHGVLTREAVAAESLPGGFGIVYPVLKAMEEAGRIRRGYFVAGLGATQFALPGALDLLRSFRPGAPDADGQEREMLALAAADPANPYGATLPWPAFVAVARFGAAATRTRQRASH